MNGSSLNATDKKPMYEIPPTFVYGGLRFWNWGSIFCIGVLGNGILLLALCPKVVNIKLTYTVNRFSTPREIPLTFSLY